MVQRSAILAMNRRQLDRLVVLQGRRRSLPLLENPVSECGARARGPGSAPPSFPTQKPSRKLPIRREPRKTTSSSEDHDPGSSDRADKEANSLARFLPFLVFLGAFLKVSSRQDFPSAPTQP